MIYCATCPTRGRCRARDGCDQGYPLAVRYEQQVLANRKVGPRPVERVPVNAPPPVESLSAAPAKPPAPRNQPKEPTMQVNPNIVSFIIFVVNGAFAIFLGVAVDVTELWNAIQAGQFVAAISALIALVTLVMRTRGTGSFIDWLRNR